ncbi:hypothetical protein IFM89_035771 [Coptis chinensis]|uniref:Uncharacterized protein n=1 Tax=Coptis chinensis TaxID=261450 RepID=A0A835M5U0_9MAGN|nr:hypothetical protein IFM89_035771 [Coptis chinensis]
MSKDEDNNRRTHKIWDGTNKSGKVFTCRGKFVKLLGTNRQYSNSCDLDLRKSSIVTSDAEAISRTNQTLLSPFPIATGFVTDREVKCREVKLRDALRSDMQFKVKEGALVEVAQHALSSKTIPVSDIDGTRISVFQKTVHLGVQCVKLDLKYFWILCEQRNANKQNRKASGCLKKQKQREKLMGEAIVGRGRQEKDS